MKHRILKKLFFLVFLKASIIPIIITSFNPIQKSFDLSLTQLGLITTLFYLFSFLGTFFWANLMGRISRILILEIGTLIWTFGLIVSFISFDFYIYLLIFSSVAFASESNTIVIINHINAISTSENITRNNSSFFILNGLGTLSGTIITSTLEQNYQMPWNYVSGYIGLIGLVYFLLIIKSIHSKQEEKETELKLNPEVSFYEIDKSHISKGNIQKILTNRINLLFIIIVIIYFPVNSFYNVWLQKYYTDTRQISQMMGSISFIFTSGAEFLGIVGSALFVDRFFQKKHHKPQFGMLLGLISFPLFYLGFLIDWNMPPASQDMDFISTCWYMFKFAIQDLGVFLAYSSLFLAFFFISMQGPIFMAIVTENNNEKERPVIINILTILNSLCWIVGPILGGVLGDWFNIRFILLIPPIIYVITSGILFFIAKIIQRNDLVSNTINIT